MVISHAAACSFKSNTDNIQQTHHQLQCVRCSHSAPANNYKQQKMTSKNVGYTDCVEGSHDMSRAWVARRWCLPDWQWTVWSRCFRCEQAPPTRYRETSSLKNVQQPAVSTHSAAGISIMPLPRRPPPIRTGCDRFLKLSPVITPNFIPLCKPVWTYTANIENLSPLGPVRGLG